MIHFDSHIVQLRQQWQQVSRQACQCAFVEFPEHTHAHKTRVFISTSISISADYTLSIYSTHRCPSADKLSKRLGGRDVRTFVLSNLIDRKWGRKFIFYLVAVHPGLCLVFYGFSLHFFRYRCLAVRRLTIAIVRSAYRMYLVGSKTGRYLATFWKSAEEQSIYGLAAVCSL